MKIRDLFVSIGFDVKDEDLNKLEKGVRSAKHMIFGLGAVVTAGTGLLVGLTKQVAGFGDQAAKTADKLGVNVEALQELRYAAELSGIAQTNFDTGLQRMTRRAAEAAEGTGVAKDALRELGVVVTDGEGRVRKSADLLEDIADGMARIEDPSKRVALAFKLFDTEGVSMVNMLRNGGAALREMRADARSLGFVIGEADARNAETFNDEMTRAQLVLVGIKNAVGVGLLPMMIRGLQQFRLWVATHREIIKANLQGAIRALTQFIRGMIDVGRVLYIILSDLVDRFGGLERAMRLAGIAGGLFMAVWAGSAIANVLMGLGAIVRALAAVRLSAITAWLAALGPAAWVPAAIAAAAAGITLVLEDIYRYIQGDKSITGLLVENFKKAFETVRLKAIEWKDKLFKIFQGIYDFIIKEILQPILDKIEAVTKFIDDPLETSAKWMGGKIQDIFSLFGMGPGDAPASTAGIVNNRQRVNVNAPINVSVPEGTPASEVAGAVRSGVSDGIQRMLQDASGYLEPATAE
ncbi:hypothetical protein DSCW_18130 [Desulfosarcina widdelii]|uniref:Phage tail tape measure protein domain-containing protein n=1 Tax=Desulfosarcina widdelii TaxID=947919 RepID=A0A5K7YYD5_9BACT|nr:hypothetical protein [Desulfosarcina widdelii]BBO74396.1 hypothetical protein DSCW_18130 [Desulfosarcina widdelii]